MFIWTLLHKMNELMNRTIKYLHVACRFKMLFAVPHWLKIQRFKKNYFRKNSNTNSRYEFPDFDLDFFVLNNNHQHFILMYLSLFQSKKKNTGIYFKFNYRSYHKSNTFLNFVSSPELNTNRSPSVKRRWRFNKQKTKTRRAGSNLFGPSGPATRKKTRWL